VVEDDEVIAHKPGNPGLLSNVVDGNPLARPRTTLIDSASSNPVRASNRTSRRRPVPRSPPSGRNIGAETQEPTSRKSLTTNYSAR
jgi:hypothetical protein